MSWKFFVMVLLLFGAASQSAHAGDQPQSYFKLHDLGRGVWAGVSAPNSPAGSNAGFVIGPRGVLVIDTFQDPAAAQAMLADIRQKTDKPIRYVVNTHYHIDHVSGNNVFAKTGAVIMAQKNVRTWERSQNLKFFGPHPTAKQKHRVTALGLPAVTYKRGITIWLGDRKIIVRTLEGHTGSDSTVIIPDAKVVFTGDIFWDHTLPNLIDANTKKQIASDNVYLRDYPDATFVPGHGKIGKAANVRAFRDYLVYLRKAIAEAQAAGKSGRALVKAVLPKMRNKYGDWRYFKYFVHKDIKQTAAERNGTKNVPVPGKP